MATELEDEPRLCQNHQNEPRLDQPIPIFCIVCSQIKDEDTRRLSPYAKAKLCPICAVNTDVCAICEEPL